MRILITGLFLFISLSCNAQQSTTELRLSDHYVLQLLDSAAASRAILNDPTDKFFERVTAAEMSIQMKQPLQPGQTRESMLPAFKAFLQADVASFTAQEVTFVSGIMKDLFANCQAFKPGLFPDTLKLIKTKANHYGESVYYTRSNCIVIPANELKARQRETFTSTMYHELFHVYSRLNPAKQKELYGLIGFVPFGYANLEVPDSLSARILHNPDGVDFAQKITLKLGKSDTIIYAVPVLYTKSLGYEPDRQEFFGYVEFALYRIEPTEQPGHWQVITGFDGYSSTLNVSTLPDFFRQIRDNTGYIIHPDEVLADNFSFLLRSKQNNYVTSRFSPEGKELLRLMEEVLKN